VAEARDLDAARGSEVARDTCDRATGFRGGDRDPTDPVAVSFPHRIGVDALLAAYLLELGPHGMPSAVPATIAASPARPELVALDRDVTRSWTSTPSAGGGDLGHGALGTGVPQQGGGDRSGGGVGHEERGLVAARAPVCAQQPGRARAPLAPACAGAVELTSFADAADVRATGALRIVPDETRGSQLP